MTASATNGAGAVGRSIGALAAGEAVNKVARFAAMVVLARTLPLDEFGLVNLGIVLGGIAVVMTRLGLPDLGTRDVAARPDRVRELAAVVVLPQAVGMAVLVAVASVLALVAGGPDTTAFVAMSGASAFGLAVSADWLLRGQSRMGVVATATALGGIVTLLGAVLVTSYSDAAPAALGAFAIGELVAAAATWRAARVGLHVPNSTSVRSMLRRAWPLAVSGAIVYAFYAGLDTVILAATRSTAEAGLYNGPYRLFLAINAIVLFAGQALLPLVTRALVADEAGDPTALVRRCMPYFVAYGLVPLAAAEIAGGPALGLMFGEVFEDGEATLMLLCLAVPWYAVGFPAGYVLIAAERQHAYLRGAAVAAAVNVVLGLALIPPMGIEGAALTTVLAFAAGAVTWMHAQGLLGAARPLLIVLAVASALAGAAALSEDVRLAAGGITLLTAVLVAPRLEVGPGRLRGQ